MKGIKFVFVCQCSASTHKLLASCGGTLQSHVGQWVQTSRPFPRPFNISSQAH